MSNFGFKLDKLAAEWVREGLADGSRPREPVVQLKKIGADTMKQTIVLAILLGMGTLTAYVRAQHEIRLYRPDEGRLELIIRDVTQADVLNLQLLVKPGSMWSSYKKTLPPLRLVCRSAI